MVLARVEDRAVFADAPRAVVEAADELADDDQVDAPGMRRAQVRVDAELRAQPQEALLGPDVGCVELGIADRALQHRVSREASRQGLVGQRRAARANRRSAEQLLVDLEVGSDGAEHVAGGGRELRPDSVPGQEHDSHLPRLTRNDADEVLRGALDRLRDAAVRRGRRPLARSGRPRRVDEEERRP